MAKYLLNKSTLSTDMVSLTVIICLVTMMQTVFANENLASIKAPKGFYGFLKDLNTQPNKKSSLLDDEGLRFKKASILDDEGLRFKKALLIDEDGSRFKKNPNNLLNKNLIIRKSVLDGEGMRFKKGSSLLDNEGMRFRRSQMGYRNNNEENDPIPYQVGKRYFPTRFFSFYPFNVDFSNSYERRSDRSGNRDILEGEGMRF